MNDVIKKEFLNFARDVRPDVSDGRHILFLKCLDDRTVELRGDYSVLTLDMDDVMKYKSLQNIVNMCEQEGIEVDNFYLEYIKWDLLSYFLNTQERYKGYYHLNKDTDKIEIFLDKDWYLSLGEHEKKMIKSHFLFSKSNGCWVSRSKIPNLWSAEDVCKRLWLEDKGSIGGKSFEEKINDKAERAERRAERYGEYAENAMKRGEERQQAINNMRGDIAFFTQPNVNSSAGRAFSRRREKMFESYFKGFEEFKKSEYWQERVEAALSTVSGTKPDDVAFINRRIKETESSIKKVKKNLDYYKDRLEKIKGGATFKKYNGTVISEYEVAKNVVDTEYQLEMLISKSVYYHKCLEDAGGIQFNKDNIQKGYKIKHKRWDLCVVTGTGPKNFTYIILEGGAKGMGGSCPYAEIESIVSTDVAEESSHPFVVGDVFSARIWKDSEYREVKYEVMKVSKERVSLKNEFGEAVSRKPKKVHNSNKWAICITDNLAGTIYKEE